MKRLLLVILLLAALVGALIFAFPSPARADDAKVVRVVDGDTVVVKSRMRTFTVRILNVDTPETKDPNEAVECLGPEAAEETERLLPPGAHVTLRHDKTQEDRYGRTLAHLRLDDGTDIGTALARAGLGVPVVVGNNDSRIGEVRAAFSEAREAKRGFFDPEEECTVPATAQQARTASKSAVALTAGLTTAAALTAYNKAAALHTKVATAYGLMQRSSTLAVKAVKISGDLQRYTESISKDLRSVRKVSERLDDIHSQRVAADEAAAEAERQRAEAAERARLAAEEEARRRAEAEAAEQARDAAREQNDDDDDGGSSGGGDNGYTGPRCYAPGGKTWKPC